MIYLYHIEVHKFYYMNMCNLSWAAVLAIFVVLGFEEINGFDHLNQAALRKINSLNKLEDLSVIDNQQLIQPKLMDSFLICTNTDENFVWTCKGMFT